MTHDNKLNIYTKNTELIDYIDLEQFDILCKKINIRNLTNLYHQVLNDTLAEIIVKNNVNDISGIKSILHRVVGSTRTLHLSAIEKQLIDLSIIINNNDKNAILDMVTQIHDTYNIINPLILQYMDKYGY